MAVDKSVISKIRRVVFSRFEPTSSLIMWGKPVGDKFTFLVFDKGAWEEVGASDGVYVPDVSVYLSAFTNDAGFVTESQLPDLSVLDNLATVATSGSYNDLTDKPPIPSLSGYATQSWVNQQGFIKGYTETDPVFIASAAHGITSSDISNWNSKTSNVGTITGIIMNGASKGTSGVVDLGTVITSHQDISGKEDKVAIVAASGTTLTAEVGKYYTLSNVGTLAVTLPTIASGTTTVQTIAFYISTGSSANVDWTSTHPVYLADGFEIAANTTYEVNALWNGIAWVLTSVTIMIN